MKRGGLLLVDWVNGYTSCYWLKHTLSFTMPRLQNAFSHLLPILDEPISYMIPMFNSTILDDPINTTFLHNILGVANRTLVDDPLPPPSPDLSDDEDATDSSIVLSDLTFFCRHCRAGEPTCIFCSRQVRTSYALQQVERPSQYPERRCENQQLL